MAAITWHAPYANTNGVDSAEALTPPCTSCGLIYLAVQACKMEILKGKNGGELEDIL